MNVPTRPHKKEVSKFIKILYIRKSSSNAMNVIISSLKRVI